MITALAALASFVQGRCEITFHLEFLAMSTSARSTKGIKSAVSDEATV